MEDEFNQALIAPIHPLRFGEGWEHRGRESFTIGLVAGGAVSFPPINLGAFHVKALRFALEWLGRLAHFLFRFLLHRQSLELGKCRFIDGLEKTVLRQLSRCFHDEQTN